MHYEKASRLQKVEAVMGGVTAMGNRVQRNRRRTYAKRLGAWHFDLEGKDNRYFEFSPFDVHFPAREAIGITRSWSGESDRTGSNVNAQSILEAPVQHIPGEYKTHHPDTGQGDQCVPNPTPQPARRLLPGTDCIVKCDECA